MDCCWFTEREATSSAVYHLSNEVGRPFQCTLVFVPGNAAASAQRARERQHGGAAGAVSRDGVFTRDAGPVALHITISPSWAGSMHRLHQSYDHVPNFCPTIADPTFSAEAAAPTTYVACSAVSVTSSLSSFAIEVNFSRAAP